MYREWSGVSGVGNVLVTEYWLTNLQINFSFQCFQDFGIIDKGLLTLSID